MSTGPTQFTTAAAAVARPMHATDGAITRRLQAGTSMIEVLVAIVVVSIGLLGVAGVQLAGMRNTYSSKQRSLATELAQDLADRIRANQTDFATGAYNQPATAPYATSRNASCVVGAAGSAIGTPVACAAGALAADDLAEWQAQISRLLGNAAGIVCRDASNQEGRYDGTSITPACTDSGDTYAIKIWWLDDRSRLGQTSNGRDAGYTGFVYRFSPARSM